MRAEIDRSECGPEPKVRIFSGHSVVHVRIDFEDRLGDVGSIEEEAKRRWNDVCALMLRRAGYEAFAAQMLSHLPNLGILVLYLLVGVVQRRLPGLAADQGVGEDRSSHRARVAGRVCLGNHPAVGMADHIPARDFQRDPQGLDVVHRAVERIAIPRLSRVGFSATQRVEVDQSVPFGQRREAMHVRMRGSRPPCDQQHRFPGSLLLMPNLRAIDRQERSGSVRETWRLGVRQWCRRRLVPRGTLGKARSGAPAWPERLGGRNGSLAFPLAAASSRGIPEGSCPERRADSDVLFLALTPYPESVIEWSRMSAVCPRFSEAD